MSAASLPSSLRVAGALIWIDLKQGLRKHLVRTNRRSRLLQVGGALFGLGFLAVLHLAAFSLVIFMGGSPSPDRVHLFAGVSTAVWCFLLFVMVSGGLMRALVVLHEQDDSSLLLASPASPRAVLAARLFGNALQSCLVDGFIILPWINVRVFVFGNWHFLWGYPVWFALAIVVTCVDGLFSFGLIRWLGLRRTRIFSQAIPFILVFGVTFFAGSMSLSVAKMNLAADHAAMPMAMQEQFIQLSHTPLVMIALAASGHLAPLLGIFALTAVLAFLTLRLTERAFVTGTQNVAENVTQRSHGRADGPFRSSVFVLELIKNLRLVVRTPMMLVQCLAQGFTPVGIAFLLGRDNLGAGVAFFAIFTGGVISGILTIAVGTVEECDDLLGMAPRSRLLFRWGKIASGCLMPCALLLVTGAVLALIGEPLKAAAVIFGGVPMAVVASIAGETFTTPLKPGTRPKLLADPIMLIPLLGLQITSALVAGITVFAAAFSGFTLFLSLLGCYLVLVVEFGLVQLRKPIFV